jgi:uncharacterized Zn-finger protein
MVKTLPCPKCQKDFNHKGKYKKHLMSHEQLKPHKCPNCGVFLSAEWILKRHLETKHSGVKPYICHQCNLHFTSKDHLHRHLNSRKHVPFVCEKCSKEFKRINSFKNHKCSGSTDSITNESKNIESIDNQSIKDIQTASNDAVKDCKTIQPALEDAIKDPATKELWACKEPLCAKSYTTRFNLRTHIRTFHELSGYSCEYCKAILMHKHTLHKHISICQQKYLDLKA